MTVLEIIAAIIIGILVILIAVVAGAVLYDEDGVHITGMFKSD